MNFNILLCVLFLLLIIFTFELLSSRHRSDQVTFLETKNHAEAQIAILNGLFYHILKNLNKKINKTKEDDTNKEFLSTEKIPPLDNQDIFENKDVNYQQKEEKMVITLNIVSNLKSLGPIIDKEGIFRIVYKYDPLINMFAPEILHSSFEVNILNKSLSFYKKFANNMLKIPILEEMLQKYQSTVKNNKKIYVTGIIKNGKPVYDKFNISSFFLTKNDIITLKDLYMKEFSFIQPFITDRITKCYDNLDPKIQPSKSSLRTKLKLNSDHFKDKMYALSNGSDCKKSKCYYIQCLNMYNKYTNELLNNFDKFSEQYKDKGKHTKERIIKNINNINNNITYLFDLATEHIPGVLNIENYSQCIDIYFLRPEKFQHELLNQDFKDLIKNDVHLTYMQTMNKINLLYSLFNDRINEIYKTELRNNYFFNLMKDRTMDEIDYLKNSTYILNWCRTYDNKKLIKTDIFKGDYNLTQILHLHQFQ